MKRVILLLSALLLLSAPADSRPDDAGPLLFRDDFNDLANWKPFYFPKIKEHTIYEIEESDGARALKAESDGSASAIVHIRSFDVRKDPRARWRWKVDSLYRNADPSTKAGDDYPIRIYIMFTYDPDAAGITDRVRYGIAKARFGSYPPHSSLSYVWSSKETEKQVFPSPYTDRARMVVLRSGTSLVGTWQEESVDILSDYRRAFGADPPASARIAIMNDSDNTGEHSVSWVDYLEVGP